jgi:SAM-dependent methyltransferase
VTAPDAAFADPRLAPLYDVFDDDRSDLDVYAAIVAELGARSVLDVGCGTGSFAVLLAANGVDVVGVDPAVASLDLGRAKPGAERVRWIEGDATTLPPLEVDLATMTGNVAQAIVEPDDWSATLSGIRRALRPGGWLAFETRDPARRAWDEWTREATRRVVAGVESWVELVDVSLPLVSFRATYVFADGEALHSDSMLRFRERDEVEADIAAQGYELVEVRDAPDRPGRELVFVARVPVTNTQTAAYVQRDETRARLSSPARRHRLRHRAFARGRVSFAEIEGARLRESHAAESPEHHGERLASEHRRPKSETHRERFDRSDGLAGWPHRRV